MDIRALTVLLQNQRLMIFSLHDLCLLLNRKDTRLIRLQLHQWARKGWVVRLKRGLYELTYPEPSVVPDYYVGNRLYEPSYVSLETALSHYQIHPETAFQVTCVTSKPTREFTNRHGSFTYFSVRPKAFFGYGIATVQGFEVRLAEPEKAVVDRLYAALRKGEKPEAVCDRWDEEDLRRLNRRKLMRYAGLFEGYSQKLKDWLHALLR